MEINLHSLPCPHARSDRDCLDGILHLLLALGELFPWGMPFILGAVIEEWPKPLDFKGNEKNLIA
jgi:hypothetical protein